MSCSHDCRGHLRVRFYNMTHFRDGRRRDWAQLDEAGVRKAFSSLDPRLDFRQLDSPTLSELEADLRRAAEEDCSATAALVVIVSSHGEEDRRGHVVVQCEDQEVQVSRLLANFTAQRCPGLAGKPKLFIIDCCRGRGGQTMVSTAGVDVKKRLPLYSEMGSDRLPDDDMLLAFATTSGHASLSTVSKGSLYLHTLCRVLQEKKNICLDTPRMFREVNLRVSSITEQMPTFLNTLSSSLCFRARRRR